MSLEHTPLDPSTLSAEVARAVGPAAPVPARMMAARGLVPLGPADMAVALYQLSLDADPKVAAAAQGQADALPDNVVGAALSAPLDGRVLDFFVQRVLEQGQLVERVLLNPQTADETFIDLASKLKDRELEILAGNQQRLLRCPQIIESLYFNPRARMSTVQRLLEMAARNGIELKRVPHFREMVANIMGQEAPVEAEEAEDEVVSAMDAAMDDLFSEAVGDLEGEDWEDEGYEREEIDERDVPLHKLPVNARIRLATLGNAMHRQMLIKDSNRMVALAAISSPGVSETEAAKFATNRSLSEDVVRYICTKKEWQKNYKIKVSLVQNPKTPLSYSMRMLPHLRMTDLRALSASKSIPSALATAARRLMKTRTR